MTTTCDFLIIGAGIAGASIGYRLSAQGRVILLEMESTPAYHSSGRSATYYNQSLGVRSVKVLTAASRDFLFDTPDGFYSYPLTHPQPTLTIARAEQEEALRARLRDMTEVGSTARLVNARTVANMVPILRTGPDYIESAIFDTAGARLDGHALLQGFLAGLRACGGRLLTNTALDQACWQDRVWVAETAAGRFAAPVLVNAAGAWADEVAVRAGVAPMGLVPMRRTVVTFDGPPGVDVSAWPFVRSIDENLYFTPESGALLLSPADETPSPPCDVQPDELDVATAVDRFERATTIEVRRLRSRWAGLRTFAADRAPVVGFDPVAPGFFWFAGQGGVGLQTAPALSELGESLITGRPIPAQLAGHGMNAGTLSPARLRS